MNSEYKILDSGNLQKLEQLGNYTVIRPALNAYWVPSNPKLWNTAAGIFQRHSGGGKWTWEKTVPQTWKISCNKLNFKIKPTDFGHIGIFPEQQDNWDWLRTIISKEKSINTLNLFAYSGGSSLAMAETGADVCHVDASRGMVDWAKENLSLNPQIKKGIRWIVDDVFKFINREIKRSHQYSGIVLDPPSFGRGPNGQVWKIENGLIPLLEKCKQLMGDNPKFILLSMHSDGFSLTSLERILKFVFGQNTLVTTGDMTITEVNGNKLSAGIYARCTFK